MYATDDVAVGPLAFVPRRVCLTSGDAARSAIGRTLWGEPGSPLAHLNLAPDEQLAAYLLTRVSMDAVSAGPAHPYHASLPPRDPFQAPLVLDVFPLFWKPEELEALQAPSLAALAATQRSRAEKIYVPLATAFQNVTTVPHPPTPRLGDWLWALVCVRSRTFLPPPPPGETASLWLEPLVDCVNHAAFEHRNTLHSYVPPGTPGRTLPNLSGAAGEHGAAALAALRPLKAGEQVLISYRDATPGGALGAADSLLRYGYLPLDPRAAPFAVSAKEAEAARARLAAAVDAATAAGAPPEALLQSALAAWSREITAAVAKDAKLALDADTRPASLAARFRLGRALALARAAMDKLPEEERMGQGLMAGVAAGSKESRLNADGRRLIYAGLAHVERPPLTPEQALAAMDA